MDGWWWSEVVACVLRGFLHTDYTDKTDAHGKVRANPQHPRDPRAVTF